MLASQAQKGKLIYEYHSLNKGFLTPLQMTEEQTSCLT